MREAGHQHGIATELIALGRVAHQQRRATGAADLFREALALSRAVNSGEYTASCLEGLAGVFGRIARVEQSARLLGAAAALRAAMGAPLAGRHRADYEHDVTAASDALGAEAFAAVHADGVALPTELAVAEALE